jgi:putative SOS response-associated peptidase YedK
VVLTRPIRGGVAVESARQLRLLTWGLVPSWAKDVKIGMRFINARAETALAAGPFGRAALARRCLVPADGWYEWQASPTVLDAKGKPRKQPFFIHRADGNPLAFAGLYEFWRDPSVADKDDPLAWLTSFTIVTTAAEPGLDRIHDRQPLVLEPDDWDRWLDPTLTDPTRWPPCWPSRGREGSRHTPSRRRSTDRRAEVSTCSTRCLRRPCGEWSTRRRAR